MVAIFTRPWFYKKGHDYLENGIIRYPSKLAVVEVAQQRARLHSIGWAASFEERFEATGYCFLVLGSGARLAYLDANPRELVQCW